MVPGTEKELTKPEKSAWMEDWTTHLSDEQLDQILWLDEYPPFPDEMSELRDEMVAMAQWTLEKRKNRRRHYR